MTTKTELHIIKVVIIQRGELDCVRGFLALFFNLVENSLFLSLLYYLFISLHKLNQIAQTTNKDINRYGEGETEEKHVHKKKTFLKRIP